MKSVGIIPIIVLSLLLVVLPLKMVGAVQQPNYPVSFSLNPSVFPINSNVSTLACITVPGPANSIAIHQNDIFGMIFDSSIGTLSLPPSPTVTLVTTPAAPATPPAAVAADFTVSLGAGNPNKLIIKYVTAATKNLQYGTNICTQVNIATAAIAGTGMVRVGSPLSTLTGNLPTITVSLVDFPTSRGSYVFVNASILSSNGSYFVPLNGFGDPTGGNFGQGNGDGFAVAAAPMPTACTFDSLQVSATTSGVAFPYVITLWKNDTPTALTCGLTTDVGSNTVTCSDTTHNVSVAAGDLVATQVSQTGFTCCTPAGTLGISLHCK
jgi:hypothetical protein